MVNKWSLSIVVMTVLIVPEIATAEIDSNTTYSLDLTDVKKIPRETQWSDPDTITIAPEGLGWGSSDDKGSRDVWLQTQPIGIGLSWRPTTVVSIKVKVDGPNDSAQLFARYSADGKQWTTWQHLDQFQGTLRVPYREQTTYQELRMDYARRDDVAWRSDEEALVQEILEREPKFFEKNTPFIGYVQFLYETGLVGGQRVKGLKVDARWMVGGKHLPPKDERAWEGRDTPWRFKAR